MELAGADRLDAEPVAGADRGDGPVAEDAMLHEFPPPGRLGECAVQCDVACSL
jgi:hypothetical protein